MMTPTCYRCTSDFFRGSQYTEKIDPKATMFRNSGAHFISTFIGDSHFSFALVKLQLRMYVAYSTAPPQKDRGSRLAKIIKRAMFTTVRCIRSALPFDAWLLSPLTCRATIADLQKRSTSAYSPPLSISSTWIQQSNRRSKMPRSVQTSLRLCLSSKIATVAGLVTHEVHQ